MSNNTSDARRRSRKGAKMNNSGQAWRTYLRLAAWLGVVGWAAGCGSSWSMVANPDYRAWQGFAPGSYVTFEGVRKMGEEVQPLRVTERLISVDEKKVVLERTTRLLGTDGPDEPKVERRLEPAQIHPADDPRTHPDAAARDLGADQVEIDGRLYACRVQQLDVKAQLERDGPPVRVCRATTWTSAAVPGAVVKIILHAKTSVHDYGVTGEVVAFEATPMRACRDE